MNENMYDVVIVGGGPAGLTAAIYLARGCYRVLVIEKEKFGGQIPLTAEVVNYPGIEQISGAQLGEQMRRQAQNFGAEFLLATVDSLSVDGDIKTVHTSKGKILCFGILLATGASPKMIGFEGEKEFKGHGVAYCATCDGEFFKGKEVFVVGGGFAAAEESVFLTKYATHVTILMRKSEFSCAKAVAQPVYENEKITVLPNTEVVKVEGRDFLEKLTYKNNQNGKETTFKDTHGFGVFVFAGYEPATSFVKELNITDERGYIVTDRTQKTSIDGIYAAGDVCIKPLRQVVTAVGDAGLAATELEKYVAAMEKKTGIKPTFSQPEKPSPTKEEQAKKQDSSLFTSDMLSQLHTVFSKMEAPLVLKVYTKNDALSNELLSYLLELSRLTDKITLEEIKDEQRAPLVEIYKNGEYSGLAFHGVPGGHEFTSFILGLYNVSGPGQSVSEDVLTRIENIKNQTSLQILVSLSCTMCPDLVVAAQRIASLSPYVCTEIYDINHFPDLKDKYHVMSVPCMVVNEDKVSFGKKNMEEILDFIHK